ncbi:MAG: hypothetical protein HYS81_05360 [Candidatus Aenigmatarchaeota archaeon]|nr:MAG: hypothetical protein HYS81_05360 [Candidatus Aenigmarchaeota archaeon]
MFAARPEATYISALDKNLVPGAITEYAKPEPIEDYRLHSNGRRAAEVDFEDGLKLFVVPARGVATGPGRLAEVLAYDKQGRVRAHAEWDAERERFAFWSSNGIDPQTFAGYCAAASALSKKVALKIAGASDELKPRGIVNYEFCSVLELLGETKLTQELAEGRVETLPDMPKSIFGREEI